MKKLIILLMFIGTAQAQEIMIESGAHLSSGSGVAGYVRYISDIRCPWDGRLGFAVGAWDGQYRNSIYTVNCNWILDEKFDFYFGGGLRKHNIPEDVNNDLNFNFGFRFRIKEFKVWGLYGWVDHTSNGEILGIGSDNHEDNIGGIGFSRSW